MSHKDALTSAIDKFNEKRIAMQNVNEDTLVFDAERINFEYDSTKEDLKEVLYEYWNAGLVTFKGM